MAGSSFLKDRGTGRFAVLLSGIEEFARSSLRCGTTEFPFFFIAFDELCKECDALGRYGQGHSTIMKIARQHPQSSKTGT